MTQRVAAARAGIGERTARKYEQAAALPSQLKRTHDWKTRRDPFEEDWPWVVSQLERDPARASLDALCPLNASDILVVIVPRRCGPYNGIFNNGAFCMVPIVR